MLIYKFGGGILTDPKNVLKTIKKALKKEEHLIVVVSAIGRYPASYATDTLSKMATAVSQKEYDRALACGEILSSIYYANLLKLDGLDAYAPSLNELGLGYNGNDLIVNGDIVKMVYQHQVTIVTGFIALNNHEIVTLPRGGSNITACFLAYYFNADLYIFTDVDGIYEVDPKKAKSKKLNKVSCDNLLTMSQANPRFFPELAIKYIQKGSFLVFYGNIKNENRTIITNY